MNDVNWATLSQFGQSVIPEKLQFISNLNGQMGNTDTNPNNPYGSILQSNVGARQLWGNEIDALNPQRAFASYEGMDQQQRQYPANLNKLFGSIPEYGRFL